MHFEISTYFLFGDHGGRSERSIQRLIKLRDTAMLSYKDCKIPIEWMFDSGMVCKVCHLLNYNPQLWFVDTDALTQTRIF